MDNECETKIQQPDLYVIDFRMRGYEYKMKYSKPKWSPSSKADEIKQPREPWNSENIE